MGNPSKIQNSFSAGEISPSLYGRTDLNKWNQGASTMRNMYVSYRGGSSSRAGLAFVGKCKQPGTDDPPRDINFQYNINQGFALEFGDQYMRVKYRGAYVTEADKNIAGATNANPLVLYIPGHSYFVDDWIYITGMEGMTELNGLTWIVASIVDADHITITDLWGDAVNSTAFGIYTSGGTAARIYTAASPYAAVDLPFLKFTQSENTMSLTLVNQDTGTEYPTYDLVRNTDTDWVFTAVSFSSVINPPGTVNATAHASAALTTYYSYVVTAVDRDTGEESVASSVASVQNNDISVNAGSNTISWSAVIGASSYNIYKATPSYSVAVPTGASFGYMATAFGTEATDTNIIADFTKVPPVHNDPFAANTITSVNITNGGTGYTQATVSYLITTTTGSGFVGSPVVQAGVVTAFTIDNGGIGYTSGDTITISGGSGATATLTLGPASGTFPGDVAYYQQRRVYANTQNRQNTYFMSKPGAYKNMDSSVPSTDDDAIIGAPWAQQINGIQAMVPMTNGLIVLTGNGAWLLNGGGNNEAITPSNQNAQAQAYNGCHDRIPPIVVNYDILYVQSKGSIIRDLAYNFYTNVFTGTDLTVLSPHLFNYRQIQQWAYCEEPYKLIWVARDDGTMLALTYLKEQEVFAWSRHDTNGFIVGTCSVTEPPVDALYVIVKRYINGQWVYYSERMDNRNWTSPENCFCVDAGLSYPMTLPDATLTPDAADGDDNLSSVILIDGGSGYTAPTVTATDATGMGTGATFSVTLSGGVITAINVLTEGSAYVEGNTQLTITDSTGSGADAHAVITNNVTFRADASVFTADNVGDVIRLGNNNSSQQGTQITISGAGKAIITEYVSDTEVIANIVEPITAVMYDNPDDMPVPAVSGQWSLSTPTTTVSGLNHLEGMLVTGLADGSVIEPQEVVDGAVTLPTEASAITIGISYICQLGSLYLDVPDAPGKIQGKRKNISSIVVRTENSRGFSVGTNEPIQATEPGNANLPWTDMIFAKERTALVSAGSAISLFTGDTYINVPSEWDEYSISCVQQIYPLPLSVLCLVTSFRPGDS